MRKLKISKNMLLLIAILIATMIMGVGYASIEGITGEIEGKVIADAQEGVFITDVEYVSDIDANINNCQIDNFLGTMLNSTIELSKTNPASEIKYKVTVYNSSTETVPFVGVVYDDDFYDNPDIIFEITTEGFQIGQSISPGETKEVYITFQYKNATTEIVPENTVLKSYLNFKMAEPNRMVVANDGDSTSNYLTSSVPKEKIESIKFEQGKEPEYSEKIISRFDASKKQDESIIGYFSDTDNNGLYELTFVSQEIIYANKSMAYMFQNLINLADIEFNDFRTIGTTNMLRMFYNCRKIKKLDLIKFDTSNVTNMQQLFQDCIALASVNLETFDTSNVNNMSYMFYDCINLEEIEIANFNTHNVTTMTFLFYKCQKIKRIDLNNWDISKVTITRSMFNGCVNLEELNIDNFNTINVTIMDAMFKDCKKLSQLNVKHFDTSNVTNINYIFSGCNSLTELDVSKWNTSNVTNMSGMFEGCKLIAELNISNFDTSKVRDMQRMFAGCSTIRGLDLQNFDTKNVLNMSCMFLNCTNLKDLNVNSFDTSQVTDMYMMFRICTSLTELDISNFNTNKVTNMGHMFSGCRKLQKIYVNNWNIDEVTNSNDMFTSVENIVGGNGTMYDSNYTDATYARIDTAETPGYFTNIKDKPTEEIKQ